MEWHTLFTIPRSEVATELELTTAVAPVLMFGPPGTGKTSDVAAMCERLGTRLCIAHCDRSVLASQLIGSHTPGTDGVWKFHAGVILDAMGHGPSGEPGTLLFDDLHELGPDGTSALYPALDGYAGASFTLEGPCPCGCGEQTVKAKEGYRVLATMNGRPEMLDEPVLSRFRFLIPITEPNAAQLAALSDPIDALCALDYKRQDKRIAEYREYRALSDYLALGRPLARALSLVFGDDYERSRKIVTALHMAEMEEASKLLNAIAGAAPSGAPDMAVGS